MAGWLDVMPPSDLARSVPAVLSSAASREEYEVCYGDDADAYPSERLRCVVATDPVETQRGEVTVSICYEIEGVPVQDDDMPVVALTVDLGDAQGMAYALRQLCRPTPASRHYDMEWAQLIDRHLCGQTTDADRLIVARALAEVPDAG